LLSPFWSRSFADAQAKDEFGGGGENRAQSAGPHWGWFVGWAVKGDRTVVFARLLLQISEAKLCF
jgi:beta-lactamase class D